MREKNQCPIARLEVVFWKRNEPQGRDQAAICLKLREWSKPSRCCKNARTERDELCRNNSPKKRLGALGVDILLCSTTEGEIPMNESQERKTRICAFGRI